MSEGLITCLDCGTQMFNVGGSACSKCEHKRKMQRKQEATQ